MVLSTKQRGKRIKNLIGLKNKTFTRPADILADVMHYCDYYFDHEDNKYKYDFQNELMIAQDYYNDEKLEEETA
jgi:hypothetical protein